MHTSLTKIIDYAIVGFVEVSCAFDLRTNSNPSSSFAGSGPVEKWAQGDMPIPSKAFHSGSVDKAQQFGPQRVHGASDLEHARKVVMAG